MKKTDPIPKPPLFEGILSVRALLSAYDSGFNNRHIEKILYSPLRKSKNPKEYAYLCHRAEERGFSIELIPEEELSRLAVGNRHGGILAVATEREYPPLTALTLPPKGFYILMEGLEDPFNFGYSLRSVYAAGCDGVILPGIRRNGADGTVCRSSAGASEYLPIYMAQPEDCLHFFQKWGYRVVCADQPNSVSVYESDLKKPLLLIVGGEKRGITRELLDRCDQIVRLDYGRDFDAALSAASAATVLAFEVLRQNR